MAKGKANYVTEGGYLAHIGSALQLSMVNPRNRITAKAYAQAMRGEDISGPFVGKGYMQREVGLAKAHAALVAMATEFGREDLIPPGQVSHPNAKAGLGWPANWNLDAIGADILAFSNPFEEDKPAPTVEEVTAVAIAALDTMPASVDLLTDEDKALALASGKAESVDTGTVSLALAEGFDIGAEPAIVSDATFFAAKALVDAPETAPAISFPTDPDPVSEAS